MSNKMCNSFERLDSKVEDEPGSKKLKRSLTSGHVDSTELHEIFVKYWHSWKPIKTDTIEIITNPYRICKISNFLMDDLFVSQIITELNDVESNRNNMDLYQFQQTKDLANVKTKNIADLYRIFQSDIKNLMEKLTRVSLSGKMSMSSATYSDTDYLLCHDDNMGDRRIAFILYLSKNWMPEDGGALDIFDTNENGQPRNIVRSLIPEYNSLVFFEVVDNSYHQVAEITSSNKFRMSINGWFHGPLRDSKKQYRSAMMCEYIEPEYTEVDIVSYVSKIYLYETIVKKIQRTIEKDSFIYLSDFLISDIFETLCDDVKSEQIKWEKIGPADLQNYEIANENTLPETLKKFYNIFKSIHIFHLLKQYTELDLVPETSEMKPKMKIELQRWSRGCYMLINEREVNKSTQDIKEETEINSTVNCLDVDFKAETDLGQREKTDEKILHKSQNENNDEYNKTPTTESGETIPRTIKDEFVPGRKVCNISHEGSIPKTENKSAKRKGKMSMSEIASSSCTNLLEKESAVSLSDESDFSDMEDYLSNSHSSSESEISETDGEEKDAKPGTLDVLLQFHTNNATDDATIDYVNPRQKDGALIHIPPQDNHLCLVYRTADICRCNKYVNHYCKGYFYTLVCSYYE